MQKVCLIRKGASGICDLVRSYEILNKSNFNQEDIKESIKSIESAIEKGIFDELTYGLGNEDFKIIIRGILVLLTYYF